MIIPARDAKRSLRDENSPSGGMKKALGMIFYLAVIGLLVWAILSLLIIFMFNSLTIDKTYFRAIPYYSEFVLPCIVIFICDVFVFCICIKRLAGSNNG